MYSHLTLGTNDFPRAEKFYDAVMAVLGHPVMFKAPVVLAYGTPTGEKLFILPPFDGQEARPGNGVHAAFKVDRRAIVDASSGLLPAPRMMRSTLRLLTLSPHRRSSR